MFFFICINDLGYILQFFAFLFNVTPYLFSMRNTDPRLDKLLPHRTQTLVFSLLLNHLDTAVLLHPLPVFCIVIAIRGDKDVTYFCPIIIHVYLTFRYKGTIFY